MYNSIFRAATAYWSLTNSEKNNALSKFKCKEGNTHVVLGKANNQGNTAEKGSKFLKKAIWRKQYLRRLVKEDG